MLQYNQASDYRIDAAYGNGTGFPSVSTGENYSLNTWHHIVANLGTEGMSLYFDNELIDSDVSGGAIVANDSSLYFGRHRTLGRYFDGLIDDVQIYKGSLTDSQVDYLFKNPGETAPNPVPEPVTTLLIGLGLIGLAGVRRKFEE